MIQTERLVLRGWCSEDAVPFYALCNDAEVMEFLGPALSMQQVEEAIARQQFFERHHRTCFWAVERKADGAMIGFCGIKPGPPKTPLEGKFEIGWRLAREAWGRGFAREAAEASVKHGFSQGMGSIWAMTVPANTRSWGLMERLGMIRQERLDFDHPAFAEGHPLRQHVVFAIAG